MKKSFIALSVVALFGLGLTSCSKCQTCSDCPDGITLQDDAGNDVTEQEFCEEDAADKDEYDQGIALIEGFGCSCK
jgi:hypothetical protein